MPKFYNLNPVTYYKETKTAHLDFQKVGVYTLIATFILLAVKL